MAGIACGSPNLGAAAGCHWRGAAMRRSRRSTLVLCRSRSLSSCRAVSRFRRSSRSPSRFSMPRLINRSRAPKRGCPECRRRRRQVIGTTEADGSTHLKAVTEGEPGIVVDASADGYMDGQTHVSAEALRAAEAAHAKTFFGHSPPLAGASRTVRRTTADSRIGVAAGISRPSPCSASDSG